MAWEIRITDTAAPDLALFEDQDELTRCLGTDPVLFVAITRLRPPPTHPS